MFTGWTMLCDGDQRKTGEMWNQLDELSTPLQKKMCWFEAADACWKHCSCLKTKHVQNQMFMWRVFKNKDVWSKTKPLGGGGGLWCRDRWWWRTVQKKPSGFSPLTKFSELRRVGYEIFTCQLTPPPHFKENKNHFRELLLSFKDNSRHVQRGWAEACLWWSHQVWTRMENWRYNHKSIVYTKVAYNVWPHSTIHHTRGSLSDNKMSKRWRNLQENISLFLLGHRPPENKQNIKNHKNLGIQSKPVWHMWKNIWKEGKEHNVSKENEATGIK